MATRGEKFQQMMEEYRSLMLEVFLGKKSIVVTEVRAASVPVAETKADRSLASHIDCEDNNEQKNGLRTLKGVFTRRDSDLCVAGSVDGPERW